MDRRAFLKQVALWSTGIVAAKPVFTIPQELMAQEAFPSTLATGTDKDYATLLVRVLEPLGGMSNFVKPGDRVVIKPNIGWDRTVEQAANTHPVVVRKLAELALDAGAKTIRIFDRTCNEKRRCYINSGIAPELKKLGDKRVRVEHMDKRKFVPVTIAKGKSLNEWSFYKEALEADCYINVPVAKQHGLSGLTLGMKNIMGVIGGRRPLIHQNMGQNLADLNMVIRPRLNVVDATRILLRNGPQGGRISDVQVLDRLIASSDIVAADGYATTLFGMDPETIDSTRAGHAMGLGQIDLAKVNLIKV